MWQIKYYVMSSGNQASVATFYRGGRQWVELERQKFAVKPSRPKRGRTWTASGRGRATGGGRGVASGGRGRGDGHRV